MKPSRDEIEKLAWVEPVVYAFLSQIKSGNFSYEEGLILMVVSLSKQNAERQKMMTEHFEKCVSPTFITQRG